MFFEVMTDKLVGVNLPERIDSENSNKIEKELETIANKHPGKNLVLKADKTTYVSSAGLRVILKLKQMGRLDSLRGVCKDVYDIFEMTGLNNVVSIEKSVETRKQVYEELLGEDAYGYLYKKDKENVIRISKNWIEDENVYHGQELSQLGLKLDVSNAIILETVKTEQGMASIYAADSFETLNAYSEKHTDKSENIIKELVKELKRYKECDEFDNKLQLEHIMLTDKVEEKLSNLWKDEKESIKRCINSLSRNNFPIFELLDDRTLLFSRNKIVFLDLSVLRYGNPVFELASAYRNILDHNSFIGLKGGDADEAWISFLRKYVENDDESIISKYINVSKAFGTLMSYVYNDELNEDIKENRINAIREAFSKNEDELINDISVIKESQEQGKRSSGDVLEINIRQRTAWHFFKKKLLLKDINMTIYPGEMVLLLGGSGAGKTTFLNAVTGYEKADAKITKGDIDIYRDYADIKHRLAFAPQQDLLRDDDTVYNTLKNAADMRLPVSKSKEEKEAEIDRMLDIFGLSDLKNSNISSLSGGQRKRASIAVEFISDPILFFLDEPDSGLDGVMARSLMEDLRKITGDSKIVIVISHAPDRTIDLFDKVIILAKSENDGAGHLAFYGSPKEAKEFFEKNTMEQILKVVNRKNEGGEGRADEYVEKFNNWR